MKPWERWALHLSSLAVAGSGFAYLWMKYVLETDDPFALVNHPWQPTMLRIHVLGSPLFVLVFGIILNSHIMKKLRATGIPNRKSGLVSLGTLATMVCSGYLLQVATNQMWLRALVTAHVVSAVVFTASYGSHLVISATLVRRRPAVSPAREVA